MPFSTQPALAASSSGDRGGAEGRGRVEREVGGAVDGGEGGLGAGAWAGFCRAEAAGARVAVKVKGSAAPAATVDPSATLEALDDVEGRAAGSRTKRATVALVFSRVVKLETSV